MSQLLHCVLCGHQISSDATFCPNCGKRDAGVEALKVSIKTSIDAFKLTLPALGTVFTSHVTALKEFGVFVALPNGGEGLVHISSLSHQQVKSVSDVTSVGASIRVKIIGVDDKGRVRLTAKLND